MVPTVSQYPSSAHTYIPRRLRGHDCFRVSSPARILIEAADGISAFNVAFVEFDILIFTSYVQISSQKKWASSLLFSMHYCFTAEWWVKKPRRLNVSNVSVNLFFQTELIISLRVLVYEALRFIPAFVCLANELQLHRYGRHCHMKSISTHTLCRAHYYVYKMIRWIIAWTCIDLIKSPPNSHARRNHTLT